MELLPWIKNKYSVHKNTSVISIFIAVVLILLLVSSITYKRSEEISVPLYVAEDFKILTNGSQNCDIFTGEWVPNPDALYYTHTMCWVIHENQNCLNNGRPNSDFLKWRWKPDGCELAIFDPYQFLDMVRDKSMAIVGDSLSRNHMHSMICLLSRVEHPVDVSTPDNPYSRYRYASYNFTIASFWAPFLIRSDEKDSRVNTSLYNLYLDEFDESWTAQIDEFNHVILNAGHWYARPAVYHENNRIVGCNDCQLPNVTDIPLTYAYRRAFQTVYKAINSRENFEGVTYLRTFAPSHFVDTSSERADCVRQSPFGRNETALEAMHLEIYTAQLEEFRVAEKKWKKKLRLVDTTQAMLMRADGHPSRYWLLPKENATVDKNDCLHWCLPGPIDSWADFLLYIMKTEAP